MVAYEDNLISPKSKNKNKEEIASWDTEERMHAEPEEDSASWSYKHNTKFSESSHTYPFNSESLSLYWSVPYCDKTGDPYSTYRAFLNMVIFSVTLPDNLFTWEHCMTVFFKNLSKNLRFGKSFSSINQSSAFRSNHSTPISCIFLCTVVCQ